MPSSFRLLSFKVSIDNDVFTSKSFIVNNLHSNGPATRAGNAIYLEDRKLSTADPEFGVWAVRLSGQRSTEPDFRRPGLCITPGRAIRVRGPAKGRDARGK